MSGEREHEKACDNIVQVAVEALDTLQALKEHSKDLLVVKRVILEDLHGTNRPDLCLTLDTLYTTISRATATVDNAIKRLSPIGNLSYAQSRLKKRKMGEDKEKGVSVVMREN